MLKICCFLADDTTLYKAAFFVTKNSGRTWEQGKEFNIHPYGVFHHFPSSEVGYMASRKRVYAIEKN